MAGLDQVTKKMLNKNINDQKYYEVRIDATVPCTLMYRVLAKSPEEAVEKIAKLYPTSIKHNIKKKRNIKATVYILGQSVIKFIKNFNS